MEVDLPFVAALDDLLVFGGALTLRLLGGEPPSEPDRDLGPFRRDGSVGTARYSLKPVRGTVRDPACRVESGA